MFCANELGSKKKKKNHEEFYTADGSVERNPDK